MNKFLAKPTGISLERHLQDVEWEAALCASSHPFIVKKYFKITGRNFQKRIQIAAKYHDIGKKHLCWQAACWKDYQDFLTNKKYGKHLQKVGLRHEIASLLFLQKKMLSDPVLVAIAAHHKKLSFQHEKRWLELAGGKELWEKFRCLSSSTWPMLSKNKFELALRKHYEFSGIRSYTQLADHRASIKESAEEQARFVPDFKPFNYEFPKEWIKRPVQELAEKFSNVPLLLLRAPTGAGKTDAALLWAKKQIELQRADRLVIAMPTRFTSNALALNVSQRVSGAGLYHSSVWFTNHSKKAKFSKENERKERLIHEFARLLEAPVTVCTIDHLLASLTLSREDHHGIIFNLAHSALVIDESDFYDDFTQANIQKLLIALRVLEVPVLIMSASLPDSSLKLYEGAGYQGIKIIEDKTDLARPRCTIKSIRSYSEPNEVKSVLERSKDRPTIIYVNTVAKSIQLFHWFKKQDINPILYHSRFIEKDKKKKEDLLLEMLGSDAWEKGAAKGIAILTQIGEISVNISADFMISEMCPIDRLVQRIGRLSRFSKKVGNLHILLPLKDSDIYPAPYGSFSRKTGWTANRAMKSTINLLDTKTYSASDFVNLVNIVYTDGNNFSNRAIDNAKTLEDSFVYNWLILPYTEMREDEEETENWKSRDIDPQVTVFIRTPSENYKNYVDFQDFKNEYGVPVQVYLAEKGIKNGSITTSEVNILDEKRNVLIASPSAYTFDEGLNIDFNFENLSC